MLAIRLQFFKLFLLAAAVGCLWPGVCVGTDDPPQVVAAVLHNWPPHYLTDKETGSPGGFAIEVFEAIAAQAGLAVKYRAYDTWTRIHQAMAGGHADLVPNMGITSERTHRYDFTGSVETFHIHAFIRETTADIQALDDLEGRDVAVVRANKGKFLMEDRGGSNLMIYGSLEEALMALISGNVDALVYPEPVVRKLAEQAGLQKRLKTVGAPLVEIKRGIAVAKGNAALHATLDKAARAFVTTPAYRAIYVKWFQAPQSYWNARRTAVAMGGVMAAAVLGLMFWRYRSMVRINKKLSASTAATEQAVQSLQLSLDAAQAGTWSWDIRTGEVIWDARMQSIFGLTPGTFDGSFAAWKNQVHPDDLPEAEAETLQAAETGERYEHEYRVRGIDGEWRMVNAQADILADSDGKPARMSGFAVDITERRQAEKLIRENAAKYRSILQTAIDGFWITDVRGNFREVNEAYASMSGYTVDELLTMNIKDVEASEMPGDVEVHLKSGIQQGFDHFETRHRRKDGSRYHVEVNFRYLEIEGGLFVTFLRDISERKQAETAVKESEVKFRSMFEHAPLSYQSLDEEGDFTDVNQTWLETLGYKREEVIGRNFSDFLKPKWKAHFAQNFPRFKAVGEVLGVEFEMVKKDGAAILVAFHGRIGKDKQGNFERTHCVFRDVSLERSAEETLKREADIDKAIADISTELLSEIYDITRVSDVTLAHAKALTGSAHGFISSIDSKTLENVGHTLTDMSGSQCRLPDPQIVFPIGPDGSYPALWGHALNTREPFFTNTPARHPSAKGLPEGHTPLENFLAVPVLIEKNRAGLIALANTARAYTTADIDAVERLADIFAFALHRNRYELEKLAMEKQLQRMQKLEAIGTLAGGIAHDFNNLLFPIVGMSEMLLEDLPPDSPEWENADEIYRAGKRGSALVKQILAFSRQSEHQVLPLRLQTVLKEVLKLARATIPSEIEISSRIQADCGMVMADPTQVHQVVMNLLTNALHAFEQAGGKIDVSLAEIDIVEDDLPDSQLNPGRYARIEVSDTGNGISPVLMDKIFEPYFTTKAKGKGTGLGLAVVHGIVREYKGDIQIDSTVDRGTTVGVFLPLLPQGEAAPEAQGPTGVESGTGHLLLVDDERAILNLEKQMLARLGYQVDTCQGSLEALEILRRDSEAYDLVITDMSMPHMSGDQLSREMLALKPDLPIIICTGFSERISAEIARDIGVKGFLLKPVVKAELGRLVRKTLDEARSKGGQQ